MPPKKKNPKKKKAPAPAPAPAHVIEELTVDQRVELIATDYDLVLQEPPNNLTDALVVNKLELLSKLTNDQSYNK